MKNGSVTHVWWFSKIVTHQRDEKEREKHELLHGI